LFSAKLANVPLICHITIAKGPFDLSIGILVELVCSIREAPLESSFVEYLKTKFLILVLVNLTNVY